MNAANMLLHRGRARGLACSFACIVTLAACAGVGGAPGQRRATSVTSTCSVESSPASGRQSFQYNGKERSYFLAIPRSYDGRKAFPLLFNFHGHGGNKEKFDAKTWMQEKGTARGYIVVTPDSLPPNWNVRSEPQRADDFGFVHSLLTQLRAQLCVDSSRIYASGHSNGAAMAGLIACRTPYEFAAAAMIAGTPPPICPKGIAPSVLIVRGTADATVRYAYAGEPNRGAVADVARYVERYQCELTASRTQLIAGVTRLRYGGCIEDAEVIFDTVEDGTHAWPGDPDLAEPALNSAAGRNYQATDAILDFFERHRLKASQQRAR